FTYRPTLGMPVLTWISGTESTWPWALAKSTCAASNSLRARLRRLRSRFVLPLAKSDLPASRWASADLRLAISELTRMYTAPLQPARPRTMNRTAIRATTRPRRGRALADWRRRLLPATPCAVSLATGLSRASSSGERNGPESISRIPTALRDGGHQISRSLRTRDPRSAVARSQPVVNGPDAARTLFGGL